MCWGWVWGVTGLSCGRVRRLNARYKRTQSLAFCCCSDEHDSDVFLYISVYILYILLPRRLCGQALFLFLLGLSDKVSRKDTVVICSDLLYTVSFILYYTCITFVASCYALLTARELFMVGILWWVGWLVRRC